MRSRKGYLTVEFTIVALFFILLLFVFQSNFNSFVPSELNKIRSSTSCSQAELLADALLNYPGNTTDWQLSSGTLNRLGFSTGKIGELNYTKWVAAQNKTYSVIANQTGLNYSFLVKYSAYIVKPPTSYKYSFGGGPQENIAIYFKNASTVGIYARNGASTRNLTAEIELFFPLANVTNVSADFSNTAIETSDSFTVANITNGSTAKVTFVMRNDSDQIHINLTSSIDALFVRELKFRASDAVYSRDYPIYFNGSSGGTGSCKVKDCPKYGTLLQDSFGSTGFLDPSRNYCEVKRKMLMINGTDKFGVDVSVLTER